MAKMANKKRLKEGAYCCPIDTGRYKDWKRKNLKRDRRNGKKEIERQLKDDNAS